MSMDRHSDPPNDFYQRTVDQSSAAVTRSLVVATSAVVEGIPDEQKTSPVRRVFCLLCLFDLICIFIMWVIYVKLITTGDIGKGLDEQVVHFRLEQSMFDIVLLALVRLLIQEAAYGIMKARKPWWTALTTTVTCAYLLVKIFFYDFKHSQYNKNSSNAMDYLLMLSSFVICWAETWFLDFRVLPKEKAARQLAEEANSLIDGNTHENGRLSYHTFNPRDRFFSPATSTPITASRYSTARPTAYHSLTGSPGERVQNAEFDPLLFKASETFDQACSLYADGHEWTHEKGDAIQGCVYSRQLTRRTKIYKVEALLPISTERLYREFIDNVDKTSDWNSTVQSARRIQCVRQDTDVVYTVSTDQLKGAVSARDCVVLRRWSQISPRLYLIANQSVEHPACPTDRRYVRAINGVGLLAFEEIAGMEDQCKFTWVLNTNLKGWLPKTVVEQAMTMTMLGYLDDLRVRINQMTGDPAILV